MNYRKTYKKKKGVSYYDYRNFGYCRALFQYDAPRCYKG